MTEFDDTYHITSHIIPTAFSKWNLLTKRVMLVHVISHRLYYNDDYVTIIVRVTGKLHKKHCRKWSDSSIGDYLMTDVTLEVVSEISEGNSSPLITLYFLRVRALKEESDRITRRVCQSVRKHVLSVKLVHRYKWNFVLGSKLSNGGILYGYSCCSNFFNFIETVTLLTLRITGCMKPEIPLYTTLKIHTLRTVSNKSHTF
jgi:hypothetical protein